MTGTRATGFKAIVAFLFIELELLLLGVFGPAWRMTKDYDLRLRTFLFRP